MNKKRLTLIALLTVMLFTLVQTVAAHPLGNFSVNRYRHITVQDDNQLTLLYVVDMAEIPTFREYSTLDADNDELITDTEKAAYLTEMSQQLGQNALLSINGEQVKWTAVNQSIVLGTGQGELPIMRLEFAFAGDTAVAASEIYEASFQDNNFEGQAGWQEVVISAEGSNALLNSSAPATDLSNQLLAYPDNWLENPPAVSSATFSFETAVSAPSNIATETTSQPLTTTAPVTTFGSDEFADLLATKLDEPGAIFIAILIAIGLGAAHALTPGHGKTIVGAYLVGSRGTAKHALFLGLTTTITHTIGVFAFGFLVLFASKFFLPEAFYPWLGVISGLLVVIIGFSMFRGRLKAYLDVPDNHEDVEGYHTHFGIGHTHTPQREPGIRNLLALGVSGGLIPCPSALILLLSAIALNKIALGLLLIVAFSVGLAGVLTAIGFALVFANRMFEMSPFTGNGRITKAIPALSALAITVAGLIITYKAVIETNIF